MHIRIKTLIIIFLAILMTSCSTYKTKKDRTGYSFIPSASAWGVPYSGVRSIYHDYVECSWQNGTQVIRLPFGLVNLILSFAADTIVLPYDLVKEADSGVIPFSERECDRIRM